MLLLLAAVAHAQNVTDSAEEIAEEIREAEMEDRNKFNPRHAVARLAFYQDEHPEFAAGIATWLVTGTIFIVIGLVLFIYSEVQAVLVVRDQDFRAKLLRQNYMERSNMAPLEEYERKIMAPRPVISLFGVLLIFVALACMFYPLCDILNVLGLPSAPCLLVITAGAFFSAICIASFWMFVVWSCTRPWAAVVFLLISFSGNMLIPTGDPLLLLLWLVVVTGLGLGYFFWLPEMYRGQQSEMPPWLQDVGNFEMSADWRVVLQTLREKADAETDKLTEAETQKER